MEIVQEFCNSKHIYIVTNTITGKSYVGQSNGNSMNYFCGGVYIKNSIQKYGRKNFSRKVLEKGDFSQKELDELEARYISEYNTLVPNGYNISIDGKGQFEPNGIAWNKGKTGIYTEAQLKVMSDKKKGIPLSEEHRKKIGLAGIGKVMSEESKYKMSLKANPVLQYSLEGNFIKEYRSVKIALEDFEDSPEIGMSCNQKIRSAGGFIWRYKTSKEIPLIIESYSPYKSNQIVQMDQDKNVIRIWDTAKECANDIGCAVERLRNACKNELLYKGFYWKYIITRGVN